ncbi:MULTISPECIES: type VI secretion system contractile sheath small subunit [Citrobacter]|uniref:Type VI secretion system contractile sheath small subunit n=1 Tax=Citrobacter sedlakii TaxID=67826 RepID=A0ABS0ZSD1_9ENTR|nr:MULTISPECIES: type VI secretion system contractile sheath small subunit [Citrobacter]EHG7613730.1 type VI secretion system contractile sheath small subunit [Citrobacter sedlakii]EKX8507627.1 type VI secretion system contractile sheath small subunit [Citrobacter sedlakii]KSY33317.1 type VI secretion protein [Citrobacter sp. 50677481]MBJ8381654.1 type VI secretion system contractile sheath small subunit [Citrobacter sedlakii]MBM9567158.1 type VI secretion system contractile sheath small subun
MAESIQHKLNRIRPPRVQITYDVETGGAIEKKELPLVVGILADLSGQPISPPEKLRERRFVEIDRDNFDDVLASISPRLAMQVNNRLANDGSKFNVELNFKTFEDFTPLNIINQIKPLQRLLLARQRLRDLLTKLDGNDDLDMLLQKVITDNAELQALRPATEDTPVDNA